MGFNYPPPSAFIGGQQPLVPVKGTPPSNPANLPPFDLVTALMVQFAIAKTWEPFLHPKDKEINFTPSFTPDNPIPGDRTRLMQNLATIARTWSWEIPPKAIYKVPTQIVSNPATQSSNKQQRKQWFRNR